MSFSIQFSNFLYKHAYFLYKPLYTVFKSKQDAYEIHLLRKHIKKGSIVLDIGSNIGYYAKILSKQVGSEGLVYCFEPDKTNFNYLKKAVHDNANVIINNQAVGSKTEKLKIYTSKELNVDHRTYKPEEYESEIEIDAISIDDYLKNINQTEVHFIKIDIQGFEMQAIKGMEQTLKNNSKIKIISEFWPYGLKAAGSSVTEYFNYLINLGFQVELLQKNSLSALNLSEVQSLENLSKEHYFNIFASRHV